MAEFKDNSNKALSELEKKIKRGAKAVGMEAEGYAKSECPVDTGLLSGSISHDVDEGATAITIHVGTNVSYARYVELDDTRYHNPGKAHFLRDSIANHGARYRDLIKASLKA